MAEIQKELHKTRDIKSTLKKFIAQHLIPPSEADFTLKKVDTLLKSITNDSFTFYSKELLQKYLDKEKIINEHISFRQIYTVLLVHKPKKEIELLYDIEYDTFSSHPKLILSPESKIPYQQYKPVELLNLLYKEINKIKAANGILVHIFDETLKKSLKTLVKYIYAKKFIKKVKIPLFEGIEPVVAREAKLIYWFEKKEKKGMVIEVEADEVLVEYKKPIFGKNGLDAFGRYLQADTLSTIHDLQVKIDEKSIYIEEDEYTKKYIAKQKGYVYFDNKLLAVDNTLRLNEVSRNKNVLDSQEEQNNIQLHIEQNDITKDSIGEGVELNSENIHVEGFVGAKSRLEATYLEIEGATHKESQQFAKYAKINRHKGTLRCHEANIKLLEGGSIHASKVTVENSLGGFIYAEEVFIKEVKNNLKIYATDSINIELVSGEDNHFEINYKEVSVVLSKIEHLQEEIERLREKKKKAERFHPEEVELIQKEILNAKSEIQKIQECYKDATITVTQAFRGLNKIIFTIDSQHQLLYKTQNKKYTTFYIEIKDDLLILQPPAISLSLSEK
jgi:hypothetical protein